MENKSGVPMLMYSNFLHRKRDKASVKENFDSFALRMAQQGGVCASYGNSGYMSVNGVAIVPVMGAMMKGWGYPDQSELAALMKSLKSDSSIRGVLKVFDSPGGSVAGTSDYGDSVAELSAVKPVIGYAEDMICSAAYWAGSQCTKLFANSTAIIGSIGVISWLTDYSEMLAEMGIKEIPLVTGKFKAAGDPSQAATPEVVDYMQNIINDLYEPFVSAVNVGRGIAKSKIKDLNAAVFVGSKAVDNGLIDGVCTIDAAFEMVSKMANKTVGKNKAALSTILDIELESCGLIS